MPKLRARVKQSYDGRGESGIADHSGSGLGVEYGRVSYSFPNCARCREFSRFMPGDVYSMYSIWAVHGSITCALSTANKELRSGNRLLHGGVFIFVCFDDGIIQHSMLMRMAKGVSIGKTHREQGRSEHELPLFHFELKNE